MWLRVPVNTVVVLEEEMVAPLDLWLARRRFYTPIVDSYILTISAPSCSEQSNAIRCKKANMLLTVTD